MEHYVYKLINLKWIKDTVSNIGTQRYTFKMS